MSTTETGNAREALERLAERVDRLERQNRRMKRVGVVAGAILALGMFTSALLPGGLLGTVGTPTVIRARAISIADKSGRERIRLAVGKEDDPTIEIRDSRGAQRLTLSEGVVGLYDDGELAVSMGVLHLTTGSDYGVIVGRGSYSAMISANETHAEVLINGRGTGLALLGTNDLGGYLTLHAPKGGAGCSLP